MPQNPNAPKIDFHAGPGTGQEVGVMFAFIAIFVILTFGYLAFWKMANKKNEARERDRRQALHEKMAASGDKKYLDEPVNEKKVDRDSAANEGYSSSIHELLTARDTKTLVHEISLILACEALSTTLSTQQGGIVGPSPHPPPTSLNHLSSTTADLVAPQDTTPLSHTYTTTHTTPSVCLVPILRSGLAMLEAFQLLLPATSPAISIHHLGLYREPSTLQPVEYYNNLPYHKPSSQPASQTDSNGSSVPEIAILLDPVIATGGTASAAIQTLLEWGVMKVVLVAVVGNEDGVRRAAGEAEMYNEGEGAGGADKEVEIWVGAVDEGLNDRGMIKPGLGDVGDRLFGTLGK
ncbi:uncharacterized protein KY384_004770 [Bacidia gigantensis]|uniref:uncharacterized protein n=1 Tax=Bacidia gigantensis TaxID=2732470 RepID=UPI001D035E5A|nr:uncharacterized protein KY384_004770 [Bacidia gigantensis]KAG8530269.1 hypothetical protein KY384_004770 [Bacidia gigantensis]